MTAVYALLGRPVHHSRSPALHNGWFRAFGIDAVYVALEVPAGAEDRVVDAVRTLGLAGANATVPLKERLVGAVDRLTDDARAIGAVNVLVRDPPDGALVGANTDAEGFCRSVEGAGHALAGRHVAIVGAGGAARAVAWGVAGRGAASVRIAARDPARGEALAVAVGASEACAVRSGPIDAGFVAGADVLVVATSGRAPAIAALDPAALAPGAVWVDLNYWDPEPIGLRAAAAAGCATVDGSGMLTWQAALAFELWTGIAAERVIARRPAG